MSKVTILMSTYNGEKYLSEQISSLLRQKNVTIDILVRDDGSTDKTKELLQEYENQGILKWYTGENLKSAKSFIDLIMKAPESDYYAFCDQDDVWNDDKLYRAVTLIERKKKDIPILYCGNYQLVDAELNDLPDNKHVSTTTFQAALVSSCCTGCTTVFNKRLKEFLTRKMPENIVMHDDWVHKVCLAIGGEVIYDQYKGLKYRQHGNNVDGGVHGVGSKIKNILKRVQQGDCIRSKQLEEIGEIYKDVIPDKNLKLLNKIIIYHNKNIIGRVKLAFNREIKTPYKHLNRGYRMAVIFKYF